jgi:hypothetical protein
MVRLFLKIAISLCVAVIIMVALIASCAKDTPKTSIQEQQAQGVKVDQAASEKLSKEMAEFKGTTWYSEDMIFEVHTDGIRTGMIVKTKYFPKDETRKLAQQLVTILNANYKGKYDYIHVQDKDGNTLAGN